MDSPGSSRVSFRDRNGLTIPAPLEWEPARVVLDVVPDQWRHCQLQINGRPLELVRRLTSGREEVCAQWDRAGTGHYQLRVVFPEGTEVQNIRIEPRKISPEAFALLLEELQRLPCDIAIGLQDGGALEGVQLGSPKEATLAQQVVRVKHAVSGRAGRPGLAAVLHELARRPHRLLRTSYEWVDRRHARRPAASQLAHALVRANNLEAPDRLKQVVDGRVEHSADVYENRFVKLYADTVTARLRRLSALTAEGRHGELASQLEGLNGEMSRRIREATFLAEVGARLSVDPHPTMVLARIAPYRAAFEGWLEFLRSPLVSLDDAALDAPLENLPHLYEVWCTLAVIRELVSTAVRAGFRVTQQRLIRHTAAGMVAELMPSGATVVTLQSKEGIQVELIPQRSYQRNRGGFRSLSFTQVPDISILRTDAGGHQVLFLLDPKYKLDSQWQQGDSDPRPKKEDIDKMHAYRDAVRDGQGQLVVGLAAILYPGPTVVYAEGLQAISARPDAMGDLESDLRGVLGRCLG